MEKLFFMIIAVFFATLIRAQDTTITFYFKSGQSRLSNNQTLILNRVQQKPVEKITVDGYADTVGKAAFNKKLSYKRALASASSIKTPYKTITGKGEVKQKVSLNKMRKVVVKIWYNQVKAEPQVKKDPIAPATVPDPCKEDTTLMFPSGTQIVLNKCYYKKIKDCFSYKEYRNARDAQQAGLRTIDEKGNPIESGGMFDIGFCSDTCLTTPLIIFMPVPPCLSKERMTIWTLTKANRWRDSGKTIEIITIKGKEFYKLEIYCPGRINCDRKRPNSKRMKVKLKNGLRIKTATLSYNCPLNSIDGKIKKRKKTVTFPYTCPQEDPLLYLKAYTKKGDTLIINNKNINDYTRKRRLISSCACEGKPKEKFLGIFKIRQKYLYKKYKIYKGDF